MTLRCYAETLNLLEAELALIDARRPLLVAGITSLRPLVELPALTEPVVGPAASTAPIAPAPTQEATPAAGAVKAPRAVAPAGQRTATGAVISDDQVVAAVRERGPIAPRALAAALGVEFHTLRLRLASLLKAGRLTASGATSNRVYAVAPDPSTPAAAPLRVPAPSSHEAVEARDRAILAHLAKGDADFAQLLAAMPDEGLAAAEREIALKSALRRLTLRGRVMDVGAKFRLAR